MEQPITEAEITTATNQALAGLTWQPRRRVDEDGQLPLPGLVRNRELLTKQEQDYLILIADHVELSATLLDQIVVRAKVPRLCGPYRRGNVGGK